jgi:quercetin dioxygenase-like cupin family protein
MKLSDDTLMAGRNDDPGETGEGDPAKTDPEHYTVIFENDRVRVLEYKDQPGARTHWHGHPDSVMYTLSSFRRRIAANGRQVEVDLSAGQVRWVGAQEHAGENIGDTDSHSIFIELKESRPEGSMTSDGGLGPSGH